MNTIKGALHSTSYLGSARSNAFSKDPIVDSIACQAIDFTSNSSALTRVGHACVFPGPQPTAFSAIGATTALGFFQAVIAARNAVSGLFAAKDMEDSYGQAISGADLTSRIAQVFGATLYLPVRFLDIATRGFNAFPSLSSLIPYLAEAGDCCFGTLFFFIGILGSISIYETSGFITRLDSALSEIASGNHDEIEALIGEMTGEGPLPSNKKISEKDLYVHLGQHLRTLLNEVDPSLTFWSWDKTLGESLFNKNKKMLPAVLNRMGIVAEDVTSEALQNSNDVIRKIWAKQNKVVYDRILGSKGSELVDRAKEMRLYELISTKRTEDYGIDVSKNLLGELRNCAKGERHRMIAYAVSGVAGAVFTVMPYAAPAYAAACAIGALLSYALISYGDFLGMRQAFKADGAAGRYSKEYLQFHLAVGLVVIALASTVFSGGIAPAAAVMVVGLIWIIMDLYALHLTYEKEKRYSADHPSLEVLLAQVKKEKKLDTSLKMFHKLPRVQREAILGSICMELESVDPKFAKELHALFSKSLNEAADGRRFHLELSSKNSSLTKRALKRANKVLIGDKKLKEDNLETHEHSDLYYKAFYQELVKREERNLLRRAGSRRLQRSVEKVSADRIKTVKSFTKKLAS